MATAISNTWLNKNKTYSCYANMYENNLFWMLTLQQITQLFDYRESRKIFLAPS